MKITSSMICLAAILALANNASAIIIDLGITTGEPADLVTELARLNGQINIYNAANNPDLPTAVLAGNSGQIDTPLGPTSIALDVTGWEYLKLKWDGKDQFYYVGADSGTFTFDSTVFNTTSPQNPPLGLSHYVFYNPTGGGGPKVPDGGATLALLGAAMVGLGVFRRKISKS